MKLNYEFIIRKKTKNPLLLLFSTNLIYDEIVLIEGKNKKQIYNKACKFMIDQMEKHSYDDEKMDIEILERTFGREI